MSSLSLHYKQPKLYRGTPRELSFQWLITGAKTITPLIQGRPVLDAFDALTQAQIDAFLGSTNEYLADKFDATAMGTDVFAAIVDMQGQADQLVYARCRTITGTTVLERMIGEEALTASTLETKAEKSSLGNLAVRAELAGLDALTSGIIDLRIGWLSN